MTLIQSTICLHHSMCVSYVCVFVFAMHGCREEWRNDPLCLDESKLAHMVAKPVSGHLEWLATRANGAQAEVLAGRVSLQFG